jgi:hypothetical protein
MKKGNQINSLSDDGVKSNTVGTTEIYAHGDHVSPAIGKVVEVRIHALRAW